MPRVRQQHRADDVAVVTSSRAMISSVCSALVIVQLLHVTTRIIVIHAQTEGDTGYDYNDAYDVDYDAESAVGLEPSFDVPIVNVTVVAGQTAVLPCSVDYLGKYKVAWLDHGSIPLTYEERRVVDDVRFLIVRPYDKEWNLQIRDIQPYDQGQYRCTINTSPVKSKVVMLHVKVPPTIVAHLSTDDVTVQEGDTVVLVCNVTGVPTPEVTWYRRPASSQSVDRERIGTVGELVIIHNVTRYCDDIYECVANNGVPPSVSRQMRVTVEFAPEIMMPNRRMGQGRGKQTILECVITAFPHTVNYWEKDEQKLTSSSKYRIEAYDEGAHTIVLSLRIQDIDQSDYGEYKCVASNPLGLDQQVMYLYEYAGPPVTNVERWRSSQAVSQLHHWSTSSYDGRVTRPLWFPAGRTSTPSSRSPGLVGDNDDDRRQLLIGGQLGSGAEEGYSRSQTTLCTLSVCVLLCHAVNCWLQCRRTLY